MSAKEKAKELIDKYYKLAESIEWTDKQTSEKAEKFNDELGTDVLKYWNELSKQSALIAVDEIIIRTRSVDTMPYNCQKIDENTKEYWQEVKQEIEKL